MWTKATNRTTSNVVLKLTLLSVCANTPLMAQQGKQRWEAEDLIATAKIINSGDLLVIRAPEPERIPFSGGRAISFVPRGKSSSLELRLPVETAGVYNVIIRGVRGPSCGNYDLYVNGEDRGQALLYSAKTIHTNLDSSTVNGIRFKKAYFEKGENTARFEFLQAQGRGGNLVLDSLELIPANRQPPQYKFDTFDPEIPAAEKLGPNLVKDPGFEEFSPQDRFTRQHEDIKGWRFNSAVPKRTECIVRDASLAHTGEKALLLHPDPLEDNAVVYQQVLTQSGHRYRVSFYARRKGAIIIMFYQTAPAKAEDTTRGYNTFPASENWQRYSFVFSPSASGKIQQTGFALYAADPDSTVYFDDVAVRKIID